MNTYLKKNARKARIRRQFFLISSAFVIAVACFLFVDAQMRSHQVQASSNEEVLYKSIRVEAEDTLWSLADQYMSPAYENKNDYINEIKEINHISGSAIQAGAYIIIPYTVFVE